MKIALIHPSRGRPQQAEKSFNHWLHNKSGRHEVEHILSIERDEFKHYSCTRWVCFNVNSNAILAINKAASNAVSEDEFYIRPDIFVVMSDDFSCPENWDDLIVQAAAGRTDWLMKTDDGQQGWLCTLPIMDSVYYNRFGYIYHPDYQHMFADTEMTHVADLLDRKIDASHLLFPHNHYSTGATPKDAINEKNDATWDQGEVLYLDRLSRNFDLLPEQIVGKLPDSSHTKWLRERGIAV